MRSANKSHCGEGVLCARPSGIWQRQAKKWVICWAGAFGNARRRFLPHCCHFCILLAAWEASGAKSDRSAVISHYHVNQADSFVPFIWPSAIFCESIYLSAVFFSERALLFLLCCRVLVIFCDFSPALARSLASNEKQFLLLFQYLLPGELLLLSLQKLNVCAPRSEI